MREPDDTAVETALVDAHRQAWGLVLSSVVRVTRDFDAAEDATQEAFASALDAWRREGVPDSPVAWLRTVAKRKALDALRREETLARKLPLLIVPPDDERSVPRGPIADDRLRLIFTCCHPALAMPARVAMTLRLLCGLTTAEIARLFLVSETTMAARLTRAKKKIRSAGIPYRVPADHELPARLPAVLATVGLLFTEGHTASRGSSLARPELVDRARDLACTLRDLMPDEAEVLGLLATIRLADGRGTARLYAGEMVPLEEQDRSRWDQAALAEGRALAAQALRRSPQHRPGPFALHAAIAAVHSEAASYEETDWPQVVALYDTLLLVQPSPVTAVARAAAYSMVEGPAAALELLDRLALDPRLGRYHGLPAVRADLLRRLDRPAEAAAAYRHAADRTDNQVEKAFLLRRAHSLSAPEAFQATDITDI